MTSSIAQYILSFLEFFGWFLLSFLCTWSHCPQIIPVLFSSTLIAYNIYFLDQELQYVKQAWHWELVSLPCSQPSLEWAQGSPFRYDILWVPPVLIHCPLNISMLFCLFLLFWLPQALPTLQNPAQVWPSPQSLPDRTSLQWAQSLKDTLYQAIDNQS